MDLSEIDLNKATEPGKLVATCFLIRKLSLNTIEKISKVIKNSKQEHDKACMQAREIIEQCETEEEILQRIQTEVK